MSEEERNQLILALSRVSCVQGYLQGIQLTSVSRPHDHCIHLLGLARDDLLEVLGAVQPLPPEVQP